MLHSSIEISDHTLLQIFFVFKPIWAISGYCCVQQNF